MTKTDVSRRRFIVTGSFALSGGLAVLAGFHKAVAGDQAGNGALRQFKSLQNQFLAISASPAATSVRQSLAHLVSALALPALAKDTLQSGGALLTGFQTAMLEAILVMTYDQTALAATITGTPLTQPQHVAINRVRGTLQNNPAVQRIIRAGATLKGQHSTLQRDVDQVIANGALTLPPVSVPNNPPLAAVATGIMALVTSSGFTRMTKALLPLIQAPYFISYLRRSSPLTVASFMPISTTVALELPNGVDPLLGPELLTAVKILVAIGTLVVAIIGGPEVLADILVIYGIGSSLTYLDYELAGLMKRLFPGGQGPAYCCY